MAWLLWLSFEIGLILGGALCHDEVPLVHIPRGQPIGIVPCVGLQPDDGVSLLYWYEGETLDEALLNLLLQYSEKEANGNFTASDRYSLASDFGLLIRNVEPADRGSYWCRFIRQGTGTQRQDQVDLIVTVVPQKPTISPCTSMQTTTCNIEAAANLAVDCTVSNAFPSPNLMWSFTGCEDNVYTPRRLFLSSQSSSFNPLTDTYNVTVALSLFEFQPQVDYTCSFECVATGVAIFEEQSSSSLRVSGKAENGANNNSNNNNSKTSLIVVIVILVIILLIVSSAFAVYFVRTRSGNKYNAVKSTGETALVGGADAMNGDHGKVIKGDDNQLIYVEDISIPEHEGSEVKGVAALSNGGLLVATKTRFLSVSPELKHHCFSGDISFKKGGSITNIAKRRAKESVVLGLENCMCTMLVNREFFINASSYTEITNPQIAMDDNGVIFAAEANSKIIYRNLEKYKLKKKHSVKIEVVNLAAYGSRIIFVNNGKFEMHKYTFKDNLPDDDIIRSTEFQNPAPITGARLGQMTISEGYLYVVIYFGAKGYHNIIQYDVERGQHLQMYDAHMSDLHGLCFFGKSKVALYGTDWVKIYEKMDRKYTDASV